MKTRHKPPTLVSMWMLDVFCCALGCVTLLWLLNNREASNEAKRAGSALELLARSESDLKRTQAELLSTRDDLDKTRRRLNAEVDDVKAKFAALTTDRNDTAKYLAATQAELTSTLAKLSKSNDELARKQKDAADLTAKLNASTQSADTLARLLRTKEKDLEELAMKAKKTEDQLNDVDARLKAVAKEAKDASANMAALKKSGDELAAAAKANTKDMQKKLDEASALIIDLQGQKAKLADKYDKLRVESDNKFAGIALTGKRVVFAVDISGSMKLLDEKTPAPGKWATVVETIAKVMRSLPGLEKFQVITFSKVSRYVLGNGSWVDYKGEESVKQVIDALTGIDPVGDTNMYDALDLAFKLRSDGLDTMYLFSDGLPTSGPGLTAEQEKALQSNTERTELLSKHVRKTLATDWNRAIGGQRVRVNAVGFFFESPEVGAFLWALARENDGSFVGMSKP